MSAISSPFKENDSLKDVGKEGGKLAKKLKEWDEKLVQRKFKTFDNVENHPNKFTAEYLFLINQTESGLPCVTQGLARALQRARSTMESTGKTRERFIEFGNSEFP